MFMYKSKLRLNVTLSVESGGAQDNSKNNWTEETLRPRIRDLTVATFRVVLLFLAFILVYQLWKPTIGIQIENFMTTTKEKKLC